MIKTTQPQIWNAMSGETAHIYALSTLENRPENYIIKTVYFRKVTFGEHTQDIAILRTEDIYTIAEVDALFESLRETIGSLPFTEMINKGIELSLYSFLNSTTKFGVESNSGGWEILSEEVISEEEVTE
jgi:hypothetical protein